MTNSLKIEVKLGTGDSFFFFCYDNLWSWNGFFLITFFSVSIIVQETVITIAKENFPIVSFVRARKL